MSGFEHAPVMADEIVAVFRNVPAGVVLDATVGGGGHSAAILESRADVEVLGLDQDPAALAAAADRLAEFGDRVELVHERFDRLDEAMASRGVSEICGALFDLGVSSHQFDVADRGFSYRHDAPLDMRMNPADSTSAADIVNHSEPSALESILRDNADEKFARRIARAICDNRPITTTRQLADVVSAAIPAPARRRGGHPAKRTFQALRIAVNHELEVLPVALDKAIASTTRGGRVAVLSYHSGEDRIVKERFRFHATGGCTCPAGLPCGCGANPRVRTVRAPRTPSADERASNPRSSSARLRVVEAI